MLCLRWALSNLPSGDRTVKVTKATSKWFLWLCHELLHSYLHKGSKVESCCNKTDNCASIKKKKIAANACHGFLNASISSTVLFSWWINAKINVFICPLIKVYLINASECLNEAFWWQLTFVPVKVKCASCKSAKWKTKKKRLFNSAFNFLLVYFIGPLRFNQDIYILVIWIFTAKNSCIRRWLGWAEGKHICQML